ncbi:hypothetical protein JW890_03570 [candidate division WOR-3 bacterium]|nr:hypothetical protein [candidate division WOR-3 bacterium]
MAKISPEDLKKKSGDFVEIVRKRAPSWFKADERKVTFSTRVRLARNFSFRETGQDRHMKTAEIVAEALAGDAFSAVPLWLLLPNERKILAERHLYNSPVSFGMFLFISPDEKISVLTNDEDDVRIQVFSLPGESGEGLSEAKKLSGRIEDLSSYARFPGGGYDTTCESNKGTGMRYSNLIHSPCVFLSGQEQKIIRAVKACGLTFRGIFGEGTKAAGSFCQISNRKAEEEEEKLISDVNYFTECLAENELFARENFVIYNKKEIEDYLRNGFESVGKKSVASLGFSEGAYVSSLLRLGFDLGIEERFSEETVSDLFFLLRKSHRDAIIKDHETKGYISLLEFIKLIAGRV